MKTLVDRIIDSHGGAERWRDVGEVLARVSMGGLEFTSRMQGSPLQEAEVTVSASMPTVSIADWPEPGCTGRFASSRVWIEAADGGVLEERCGPGAVFRTFRHWFLWDRLDVLYYCGLSLWQALCLPFSLLRSGCELEQLEPLELAGERLQALRVVFPADVPTYSPDQILYADAAGLLRRMDYAPNLYGAFWRVGQSLEEHESFAGFVHATRRRVFPCMPNGQLLRATRLGWMEINDVSYTRRSVSADSGATAS